MASDLRRLATAQAEHFANHGRFATQFSRLGIRYIPHAGVNVRITHAGVTGWAARATHAEFEGVECVIEVGDPTGSGTVPVPPGSGGEPSCRP